MKKVNPQKSREERKEIIRLLKLLKKYSQRKGQIFPKRDCYIDTYIFKYAKKDFEFSRQSFTHCDAQKAEDSEKIMAVPQYMANTFKPFLSEFFETEGIKEPFRLEVLQGYRLKLAPHTNASPVEVARMEYSGVSKDHNSVDISFFEDWIRTFSLKTIASEIYSAIFNVFLDGIFRPHRLVLRAKSNSYPKPEALLWFVGASYLCIEKIHFTILNLVQNPIVVINPKEMERAREVIKFIEFGVSIPAMSLAVVSLLFIPICLIWLYSFLRGAKIKECIVLPASPTTYVHTLNLVMYNAAFFAIIGTFFFISQFELSISNSPSILDMLVTSGLYLLTFYGLYAYLRAYNLLFELPPKSGLVLAWFILGISILLEFIPQLYFVCRAETFLFICGAFVIIRFISKKYPNVRES